MKSTKKIDRKRIGPLINQYHAATRESRARWYASRPGLTDHTKQMVTEVVSLLKEADAATRQTARTRLSELVDHISRAIHKYGEQPLMDVFGWAHFSDMNLYEDDSDSRANARSFATVLETLNQNHITREEVGTILLRLYGSNISHIGPGLTGLLYFLQPEVCPVLGQKALRGIKILWGQTTRPGKEGLKQLAGHLQRIWHMADDYHDILDSDDLADISGFLYWIASNDQLEDLMVVKESSTEYQADRLEDIPLSITKKQIQAGIDEISLRLAIDPGAIEQAVFNLLLGKSLILTGPPGTGKTELARMLPKVFWNIYPIVVTATAEWTAYEVIGGLFPEVVHQEDSNDQLKFTIRQGCVYDAVIKNWQAHSTEFKAPRRKQYTPADEDHIYDGTWLVIDEFNRADIDRAFGDLFTSLESGQLRVPAVDENNQSATYKMIPIPLHFRIIGTLNTFDKHHLFEMSDALKRRFAFVEIQPHEDLSVEQHVVLDRAAGAIRQQGISIDRAILQSLSQQFFYWLQFVRVFRTIGTAQAISVLSFTGLCISYEKDGIEALSDGIKAHVVSQLEGLPRDQLEVIGYFSEGAYSALFAHFEQRMVTQMPSRQDLKDLCRFSLYLSEICTGGEKDLAQQIFVATDQQDTEKVQQIESILTGTATHSNWRDAFTDKIKGPILPSVARSLRELADEWT